MTYFGFLGTNGAYYGVCDAGFCPKIVCKSLARVHVHITHPRHEDRVIVGGYDNNVFDSFERALYWAESDSRAT